MRVFSTRCIGFLRSKAFWHSGAACFSPFYFCAPWPEIPDGRPRIRRGNLSNCLRYFPTQAMNFAFKEKYQRIFVRPREEVGFGLWFAGFLAAGGAAGATALTVSYPLEFTYTRLAADTGGHAHGAAPAAGAPAARQYKGIADCRVQVSVHRRRCLSVYYLLWSMFCNRMCGGYCIADAARRRRRSSRTACAASTAATAPPSPASSCTAPVRPRSDEKISYHIIVTFHMIVTYHFMS